MTEVLSKAKANKLYTWGIENKVCNARDSKKREWKWLIFYDFDGNFDATKKSIVGLHENTSFIIYSTKHGHHLVGFTPLTAITWALLFDSLEKDFDSFYNGGVMRLMLKRDEVQKLVRSSFEHPVIPRLYNIYSKRFDLPEIPNYRFTEEKWYPVPMGYFTGKE